MARLAIVEDAEAPQGLYALLPAPMTSFAAPTSTAAGHNGTQTGERLDVGPLAAQVAQAARVALPPGTPWPTRQLAAWRYTPLPALVQGAWRIQGPQEATADVPEGLAERLAPYTGARLVFVDGCLSPTLCAAGATAPKVANAGRDAAGEPALWFGRLADAEAAELPWLADVASAQRLHEGGSLPAVNAALCADPVVVYLGARTREQGGGGGGAAEALRIVHVHSAAAPAWATNMPRTIIVLGAGRALSVVEHHLGQGHAAHWCNAVTEASIGEGAHLQHVLLQQEGTATQHTSFLAARLVDRARLDAFALMAGGRMARRDVRAYIDGPGAHVKVSGLSLGRGSAHQGFAIDVHHRQPHAESSQHVRCILDDEATSAFVGSVYVDPGAIKTKARQLCRNLLRSPRAHAHAQPQLCILTDDVTCAHGATMGQLDADALFYLQSRNLPLALANQWLAYVEAAGAIDDAPEAERPELLEAVADFLGLAGEVGPEGLQVPMEAMGP